MNTFARRLFYTAFAVLCAFFGAWNLSGTPKSADWTLGAYIVIGLIVMTGFLLAWRLKVSDRQYQLCNMVISDLLKVSTNLHGDVRGTFIAQFVQRLIEHPDIMRQLKLDPMVKSVVIGYCQKRKFDQQESLKTAPTKSLREAIQADVVHMELIIKTLDDRRPWPAEPEDHAY